MFDTVRITKFVGGEKRYLFGNKTFTEDKAHARIFTLQEAVNHAKMWFSALEGDECTFNIELDCNI